MKIVQTARLQLRELNKRDAEFIYRLLNQESWKKYIGDKQISSSDDANSYIQNGPCVMYQKYGFGLWAVDLIESSQTIGICGLIKRDNLPEIDLGFAFLDEYTGRDYAFEACVGVINHAKNSLAKRQLMAIAMPENQRSIHLLKKLGFRLEDGNFAMVGSSGKLNLFLLQLQLESIKLQHAEFKKFKHAA